MHLIFCVGVIFLPLNFCNYIFVVKMHFIFSIVISISLLRLCHRICMIYKWFNFHHLWFMSWEIQSSVSSVTVKPRICVPAIPVTKCAHVKTCKFANQFFLLNLLKHCTLLEISCKLLINIIFTVFIIQNRGF